MKLKKKKLLFAFLAGFFLVGQLGINNAVAEGHGGNNHGEEHREGPPIFEEVDTNGDGFVDREEAHAAFADDPNIDETFDRVDANDDGLVDHGEFAAEVAAQQMEQGDFGDVNQDHDGAPGADGSSSK